MESIDAVNQFRLIACPTISHERRQDRYFSAGRTVGDYLRELGWKTDGLHARVFIDGQYIPDAEWLSAEPKAGQAVVVRRVLGNGGGGNTGKQIGMIVGMLVLALGAIAAPAALAGLAANMGASAGTWAGIIAARGAITAGVLVAGSLAMHGPIPMPLPRRLEAP